MRTCVWVQFEAVKSYGRVGCASVGNTHQFLAYEEYNYPQEL